MVAWCPKRQLTPQLGDAPPSASDVDRGATGAFTGAAFGNVVHFLPPIFYLTSFLLDVSSDKMPQKDLQAFKAKLKSKIEQSYSGQASGKVKDKNWNYKWSASADLRVINAWKDVQKDDHVIRIVDKTKTGARGESATGGMLIDLKASIFKRGPNSSPDETGAHEVGHTGGLENDNRSPNLMMEGGRRPDGVRNISLEQIQTIWQSSKEGKLNQRDKVMGELDDIAKRR